MTDDSQVAALGGVSTTAAPELTGLQARAYTHPALAGRTVVRLVQDNLVEAEDLSLKTLFFTPAGGTSVGYVRSRAIGFPAWPIVNDPQNAHHALNLVGDLRRVAKQARTKPGNAKDSLDRLAKTLGDSAPHFLPTFLEEAARIFLRHDNRDYAAQFFGKAREAERVHNLAVDEERHRQAMLEFALAGALSAKELSAESKALLERQAPEPALESFLRLNIERVKGGMPPYGGLATDLRRLARAAKVPQQEALTQFLQAVIGSPALEKAPAAFWKSFKSPLVALVREQPETRQALLALVPAAVPSDDWVGLLEDTGAVAELLEGRSDARAWAERYTRALQNTEDAAYPRRLSLLVRRLPGLAGQKVRLRSLLNRLQPELLDALLETGARVVFDESRTYGRLDLEPWVAAEERPDLGFLADSEHAGIAAPAAGEMAKKHLDLLLAHPGARRLLGQWNESRLGEHPTAVEVHQECLRLQPLFSPQARAAYPRQLAELTRHLDTPTLLAGVLRDGLLVEYTWPALETAAASLGGEVTLHESFPAVGVAAAGRVIWVDGQERVAQATFTPRHASHHEDWDYLLVGEATACAAYIESWSRVLLWSTRPGLERDLDPFFQDSRSTLTLPVPEGRLVGAHLVRPGDLENPFHYRSRLFQEGTHYWADGREVREVDPDTGTKGRRSLPGPLAGLVEPYLREGWELKPYNTTWCPTYPTTSASCFSTAAGRHVWVALSRDAEYLYLDADGQATVSSTTSLLRGRLQRPGGGAWIASWDGLCREEDQAPLLPAAGADGCKHLLHRLPWAGWHQLQVRNAAVSARLRAVTPAQAAMLLAVVPAAKHLENKSGADSSSQEDASRVLNWKARLAASLLLRSKDADLVNAVIWAAARVKRIVSEPQTWLQATPEAPCSFLGEASTSLMGWATGAGDSTTDREGTLDIGRRLAGAEIPLISVRFNTAYLLTHPLALLFSATRPLAPRKVVLQAAAAFGDVVDAGIYSPSCCVFDVPGLDVPEAAGVPARVVRTRRGPAVLIGSNFVFAAWATAARFYSPSGGVPRFVDWRPTKVVMRGCGLEAGVLLEAFRVLLEQGAPPWDPQKVTRLAEGTGWEPAAAALLLAGLPEQWASSANFLGKDLRELLGLKAKEARSGREFLDGLGRETLLRLVEAGAADPLRLVREGLDVEAVIAAWRREQSRLSLSGAARPFYLPGELLSAADSAFAWNGAQRLRDLGEEPDTQYLDIWLWAVTQARPGSDLAAWLAQVYTDMRQHAARSSLELIDHDSGLRAVLGLPKVDETTPEGTVDTVAGWSLTWNGSSSGVVWNPRKSRDWEKDRRILAAVPGGERLFSLLRYRLDVLVGSYDEIAADLLVEASGHPKDPLASAPQVVAEVSRVLGLEQDPARYWLQLLALSDPTEARVQEWNGWTRAQRLAAGAPLLEQGLVIEAKRERAGRRLFLPGGWLEASRPHLPLEVWKAPFYDLSDGPRVTPNLGVVVPLTTMRRLFEDAWRRYQDGDRPGYTELRTERYRRR
ncbi:hypothetical protein [Actinomyces weissii]|uniref:DUF4132 domain-containing protein n=1 Tax=Actinomyces weissii TaxID=675090 RepID=A0A7T7S1T3_9ACTO|nr:hypothetical protein [Actinomyces weissii]QQM66927.1 hypothetical protein JG540_07665 [Actinomyces weissii]